MTDISRFAKLVTGDHRLAVVALALPDGTTHASVANAGVIRHPVTSAPVVGIVGGAGPASSNTRGHGRARPS